MERGPQYPVLYSGRITHSVRVKIFKKCLHVNHPQYNNAAVLMCWSSLIMYLADIYLFKIKQKDTRTTSEFCSTLTIKTPTRRQCRRSDVLIVNFEHISHIPLLIILLLWTSKCEMDNGSLQISFKVETGHT